MKCFFIKKHLCNLFNIQGVFYCLCLNTNILFYQVQCTRKKRPQKLQVLDYNNNILLTSDLRSIWWSFCSCRAPVQSGSHALHDNHRDLANSQRTRQVILSSLLNAVHLWRTYVSVYDGSVLKSWQTKPHRRNPQATMQSDAFHHALILY